MDEDLQNIEELFRDSLENNEEIPPQKVWNDIYYILDKENAVTIKKKYTSLKRLTLLLLFLLSAMVLYEFSNLFKKREIENVYSSKARNEVAANSIINPNPANLQIPHTAKSSISRKGFSMTTIASNIPVLKKNRQRISNGTFYNNNVETYVVPGLIKHSDIKPIDKTSLITNAFVDYPKIMSPNFINFSSKNNTAFNKLTKRKKQSRFSLTIFFSLMLHGIV